MKERDHIFLVSVAFLDLSQRRTEAIEKSL